jgi:integrase
VRLAIPVLSELRAMQSGLERHATVICTREDGRAWKADHFKHAFAKCRQKLGLPNDVHFHGLRHLAGKRLAEAGCTPQEIAASLDHKTLAMTAHDTAPPRRRSRKPPSPSSKNIPGRKV